MCIGHRAPFCPFRQEFLCLKFRIRPPFLKNKQRPTTTVSISKKPSFAFLFSVKILPSSVSKSSMMTNHSIDDLKAVHAQDASNFHLDINLKCVENGRVHAIHAFRGQFLEQHEHLVKLRRTVLVVSIYVYLRY